METIKEKNYWMTMNKIAWIISLTVSFFVFFPAFAALLILWALGKVRVID